MRVKLGVLLREEHRLRGMFGPKVEDVIRNWRKLHDEELPD